MKNIKNSLFYLITLFFFNLSYCQQKTVYEKKVDEITLKLLKELGVSQTQINRVNEMGNIEGMLMGADIMKKLTTMEGLIIMERYNNEIKKVEKLKTEVDFKKDKIKKEKELELKRTIEQEKNKNKLLEEFNNSDYSIISKKIKLEFENWLRKSEFEKQEDFLKRINKNSQKSFDSICNSILLQAISKVETFNDLSLEINEYDADKEFFKVKIKIFKIL